jgi:hypothetical protein
MLRYGKGGLGFSPGQSTYLIDIFVINWQLKIKTHGRWRISKVPLNTIIYDFTAPISIKNFLPISITNQSAIYVDVV